jgi:hypothetical protein
MRVGQSSLSPCGQDLVDLTRHPVGTTTMKLTTVYKEKVAKRNPMTTDISYADQEEHKL